MIEYLTLILCCQLLGELAVSALNAPLPGPVAGMVLLLAYLLVKGGVPEPLAQLSDSLLNNLSLLFVPAGVGVMLHFDLLGNELIPLSIALVLSTLVTIAVTALLMVWFNRGQSESGQSGSDSRQ